MMKLFKTLLLPLFFLSFTFVFGQKTFNYPAFPKCDSVNTYFGTTVADPYRGLEDINSPQTLEWVKQQQVLVQQFESGK
jgi:hypothetical protein